MGQICSFLWTRKNEKAFSFRGASPPTPHRGLCPWTPAGGSAPSPRYRLALRARHGIQTLCSSKLIFKKALISPRKRRSVRGVSRFSKPYSPGPGTAGPTSTTFGMCILWVWDITSMKQNSDFRRMRPAAPPTIYPSRYSPTLCTCTSQLQARSHRHAICIQAKNLTAGNSSRHIRQQSRPSTEIDDPDRPGCRFMNIIRHKHDQTALTANGPICMTLYMPVLALIV